MRTYDIFAYCTGLQKCIDLIGLYNSSKSAMSQKVVYVMRTLS